MLAHRTCVSTHRSRAATAGHPPLPLPLPLPPLLHGQALEREGVDTLFAYPGGASMEIHQALTRSDTIRNILCRHEQVGLKRQGACAWVGQLRGGQLRGGREFIAVAQTTVAVRLGRQDSLKREAGVMWASLGVARPAKTSPPLFRHRACAPLAAHAQGEIFAAEGYAKVTGRVGVCIATSGPGATNLVTGLADALLDSVPLVAITGQVPRKLIGSDAFQETPIVEVCACVCVLGEREGGGLPAASERVLCAAPAPISPRRGWPAAAWPVSSVGACT